MKIIMDLITGFFENLLYTLTSLLFVFFVKKWYFNYVNKHLLNSNYHYFLNTRNHIMYNAFKKENTCSVGNLEIIKFDGDLRLRLKSKEGAIKVMKISKYNMPIDFYYKVLIRIVKNQFLKIIEKESEPVLSIGVSKKLDSLIADEVSILENN